MNWRQTVAIINGETKTLQEWAEIADIKYIEIRTRFLDGVTGEELLMPDDDIVVSRADIRRFWGKWVWRPDKKKKRINQKYWRENYKWIYKK